MLSNERVEAVGREVFTKWTCVCCDEELIAPGRSLPVGWYEMAGSEIRVYACCIECLNEVVKNWMKSKVERPMGG